MHEPHDLIVVIRLELHGFGVHRLSPRVEGVAVSHVPMIRPEKSLQRIQLPTSQTNCKRVIQPESKAKIRSKGPILAYHFSFGVQSKAVLSSPFRHMLRGANW